jgi:hypothetical protein
MSTILICPTFNSNPRFYGEFLIGGVDSTNPLTIDITAIGAVIDRKIRCPSETGCQPCSIEWFNSLSVQPPSGPMAIDMEAEGLMLISK